MNKPAHTPPSGMTNIDTMAISILIRDTSYQRKTLNYVNTKECWKKLTTDADRNDQVLLVILNGNTVLYNGLTDDKVLTVSNLITFFI